MNTQTVVHRHTVANIVECGDTATATCTECGKSVQSFVSGSRSVWSKWF